jgi:hypothetical protein
MEHEDTHVTRFELTVVLKIDPAALVVFTVEPGMTV